MQAIITQLFALKKWKVSVIKLTLMVTLAVATSNVLGQAANIDQIRNGPANNPAKNTYDEPAFDNNPTWVNGNAGASNAHYVEGMSISYRSLLTGLTVGTVYEYVIEYDTKHSSKHAIDYLTHYQRLEPHGPFGHAAEVINPLIFESGSDEYLMGVVSGPGTMAFDPPSTAGTPVAGQPLTSFNALPAAEKVMTIYNGTLQDISYVNQGNLSLAQTATSVRIRFQAGKDSVLLTWGGHIASRLDWLFINGVPRSAGGISGSPYHMRHLSMRNVTAGQDISLGNQDRSLSAAAVVPPPDCPTVPSQTICSGTAFQAFTIASPQAGATYQWSFGTNTVGATFTGGASTATGNSVSVVAPAGGFTSGGSFTLNITASLNGINQTCNGVATGTVEHVVVTASANPTTIDITSSAHNTTLTADIGAASSDPNNANYTYLWEIVTAGTDGQLTNATSRIATYTAGPLDAGQSIQFKVTATQAADANSPECVDDETVTVTVNTVGVCDVSPSSAVCAGTEVTHSGSPDPKPSTATYLWSLQGFGGTGSTSSTLVGTNGLTSIKVNATQSYRIVLTQTYQNTAVSTSCFEDVEVVPTPSVSAAYIPPNCSETTFKVQVTSPVNGLTYTVTQPGNSLTYPPITKTAAITDVIFSGLKQGDGWTVTVSTGGPGCTASTSCEDNPEPIGENSVVDPSTTLEKDATKKDALKPLADDVTDTYDISLESKTKVTALPNPFTDKVRFNLVSGVSGLATLEIHNVLGQKVGVVFQGYLRSGQTISKEFYVPTKDRGNLFYTFRVGDQKISGKLLAK